MQGKLRVWIPVLNEAWARIYVISAISVYNTDDFEFYFCTRVPSCCKNFSTCFFFQKYYVAKVKGWWSLAVLNHCKKSLKLPHWIIVKTWFKLVAWSKTHHDLCENTFTFNIWIIDLFDLQKKSIHKIIIKIL